MNDTDFIASLSGSFDKSEAAAMLRWLKSDGITADQFIIDRLNSGEPLAYILGYSWFYNRRFKTTADTLIPRPETEELCDIIIRKYKGKQGILGTDIGTGSGCIAITLCAELPGSKWHAIDASEAALKVAMMNAASHHLTENTRFQQLNFLEETPGNHFNLIVSNPPYVHRSESAHIADSVLKWEPESALFPEGEDVLIFYRQLAELLRLQAQESELWAEINPLWASETLLLFKSFSESELIEDMSGKQRFIRAKKEGH